MSDNRKHAAALVLLVALAGCSTLGASGTAPDATTASSTETAEPAPETIATLENLSVRPLELNGSDEGRYCEVQYTVSKDSGVIVEVRSGFESTFYSDGGRQYHRDRPAVNDWIVLSTTFIGENSTSDQVTINAYEVPSDGGRGESVQLAKFSVTDGCEAVRGGH